MILVTVKTAGRPPVLLLRYQDLVSTKGELRLELQEIDERNETKNLYGVTQMPIQKIIPRDSGTDDHQHADLVLLQHGGCNLCRPS